MTTFNLVDATSNFTSAPTISLTASQSTTLYKDQININGTQFTFSVFLTAYKPAVYAYQIGVTGSSFFFWVSTTLGNPTQSFSATLDISPFTGSWASTPTAVVSLNGFDTGSVTANTSKITFSGFSTSPGATGKLYSITVNYVCFTEGTLISTPDGDVEVQNLQPGDLVKTADGRVLPVRWIGQQQVDTRLHHPAKVNPVTICAGALGDGLPKRDLRVSPDHAVAIDGTLFNAAALVNGSTITQDRSAPSGGFTYYHVELDEHDLILAEGVATESYVDYASREYFDNDDGYQVHIAEMPLPRISSARMVPDVIKERIAYNIPQRAA